MNTQKVLKCGAGEGWRRSAGLIVWEMNRGYIELRRTRISYKNKRKVILIGHILRRNCLL